VKSITHITLLFSDRDSEKVGIFFDGREDTEVLSWVNRLSWILSKVS
jgi:hypothetical protein